MNGEGEQEALRPLRGMPPEEWPIELVQAESLVTTLWSTLNELCAVLPESPERDHVQQVLDDTATTIERMLDGSESGDDVEVDREQGL